MRSGLGNKEIFARNLKYYLDKKQVTQKDVCKILNFKETTFSEWVRAKSYPRIDKIEILANYFNIEKSDLIEDKTSINNGYYHDKEVAEIAEQLRTNPEGRILFDASRDLSKEDIDIVLNLINSLKAREKK